MPDRSITTKVYHDELQNLRVARRGSIQCADVRIARVQNHVMRNLGARHTLASLAREIGMSARNLARHFVRETGITPRKFVERTRIDEARRMLEGSRLPLKAIAYDCGFGTPDHMRVVFTERLGVTPNQYRASFHRTEMDEEG